MDLEQVGKIRRIAAAEQLLQVLEEHLARNVRAEKLFLQRLASQSAKIGFREFSTDSSRNATTAKVAYFASSAG